MAIRPNKLFGRKHHMFLDLIGDLITGDIIGGEEGIGNVLLGSLLDSLLDFGGQSTGSFGSS